MYEHPARVLPEGSVGSLYLDTVAGVLADAGLSVADIDGLHTSQVEGSEIGLTELLGLGHVRHIDGTELGGATYVSALASGARAIEAGLASVVLVVMGGIPRRNLGNLVDPGPLGRYSRSAGSTLVSEYALVAQRYLYEYGASRRDLAEVKVASAYHASHNPRALLPKPVSLEEVMEQPPIASPLHRMDCCVVTDGGGAYLLASEEIAESLGGPKIVVAGGSDASHNWNNGSVNLLRSGALKTGPDAMARAGISVDQIDYASIYDSFTITLLVTLEQLGFCRPGQGGDFIRHEGIAGPGARLPVNTDGGGLSNHHPDFRGGMIRTLEAVRQLRGTAHPAVQVPGAEHALVHGSGFSLGTRSFSSTSILRRVS